MEKMTKEQLANMFDHTLLKPFATNEDFQRPVSYTHLTLPTNSLV